MSELSESSVKKEIEKKWWLINNIVITSKLEEYYDKFCKNDNEIKDKTYYCRSPNIFTMNNFLTNERYDDM